MAAQHRLGARSRARLRGVFVDLVVVVARAIELTAQDFAVIEGLRSRERQAELYREGKTRTMDSRHLSGMAVDLAAWHGSASWAPDLLLPVAEAMRDAARRCDVRLRWGGCWQILNDLDDLAAAVAAYQQRRGDAAFVDLAHFEIPKGA